MEIKVYCNENNVILIQNQGGSEMTYDRKKLSLCALLQNNEGYNVPEI